MLISSALALLFGACDRTPPRQQTRAGTAIGLETRHTAAAIAESIVLRPDLACGVYTIEGPVTVEANWVVEGERAGEIVLELDETRTLEIDASDRIRYRRMVDFRSEHGRIGQRSREWLLLNEHLYTRELNLPFERRQADALDRDALIDEPRQVFETLVQATANRWREVQPDAVEIASGWRLETTEGVQQGFPVSCGRTSRDDPWLRHLLARAEVTQGLARVELDRTTGEPITRTGSWTIEPLNNDDYRLRVAVEETIRRSVSGDPIEPPNDVFDSTRLRPHSTLTNFLRELDGLPPSHAGEDSGEDTPSPSGEGRGEGSN